MTKYAKIFKDPKDGKEYFIIYDEKTESEPQKESSHLVVITNRDSVILREREGHVKTNKNHIHSGFRDERISTFKGQDAPLHAVRYLVEKFGLTDPTIWERP
jgi:hypothetical protein